ncbi:MAG TPA: MHYT domain-containing protein [Bryobacteraceae bacterium]|nr:MHYT domain-containing protein [Bryobacteraceae bacterium]
MPLDTAWTGSYDFRLVTLSVVLAVLASWAALDLGGRVTAARGWPRFLWLTGGSLAMGLGIWAMHYVGMLAYSLPVAVLYDWPTVLLSLLAAVIAAFIALFIVSRRSMGILSIAFGGLLMGAGIASMHYIGMDAMRLPAMCRYSGPVVALSVVLAIVISWVGLWLTFHLREETRSMGWQKMASALLMGLAIPIMHYTGMAAVSFVPMSGPFDVSHSVSVTALGGVGVVAIALTVLTLAILTSFVDRRFSAQAMALLQSEERYRQIVESVQVVLWKADISGAQLSYINHGAERLLGYPLEQWTGAPSFLADHVHPDDRQMVIAHCAAAGNGPEAQSFEHRMLTADGRIVWLRTSILLVTSGGKQELVGVMTDITERRQAQKAAEEANRASAGFLAEIKRLNEQLTRENVRMSSELEVTQRLQKMILPCDEDLRAFAGLDISGHMEAATEVGGDYFDVVAHENGIVLGIGDVTGHGLESGVLAIMVQTAIRTLLASGSYESRKFLEVLNRVVYDNSHRMKSDRSLTLTLLHYQDRFVTISGQHEEILIMRANGSLERHDTIDLGFPLGLERDISPFIGESKVPLESGDVMVAYTDGITEAINPEGCQYGVERLADVLKRSHSQPASRIRETVLQSLRDYIGVQQLLDDVSLLVVKPA